MAKNNSKINSSKYFNPNKQNIKACSDKQEQPLNKETLADFRQLYTSKDKRLCLFEHKDGHLTLVKSARLV